MTKNNAKLFGGIFFKWPEELLIARFPIKINKIYLSLLLAECFFKNQC